MVLPLNTGSRYTPVLVFANKSQIKTIIVLYLQCKRIAMDTEKITVSMKKRPFKIGGAHSTIIGGRHGKKLVNIISLHPEVKKVIPSVITVKGKGLAGGLISAKVLRSDGRGNLRMLISHGTAAQELRIITTVGDTAAGERVMNDLNSLLFDYPEQV
jgi:hypothetical protein